MKSNPYKNLPPLERKPDGTPYRMTPAQRKRANSLIRRAYCNCEGGNCIVLDDGDACACPQMVSVGCASDGQGIGSGDLLRGQGEAVRRLRCGFRPTLQPGEVLLGVCEAGTQATEERQRQEAPLEYGQIGAEKAP